jgi:hypothetical protein
MNAPRQRLIMAWTAPGITTEQPARPTQLCGLRWMSLGQNWPASQEHLPAGVRRCPDCAAILARAFRRDGRPR